jgi:predicted secreted protein
VGEAFSVELKASPTTGYKWHAPDLPHGLDLIDAGFAPVAGAEPGDAGTQHFRLRATATGRHRLTFSLKRPWEQEPIDSRTVDVEVT